MLSVKIKIRIILWLALAGVVGWLFVMAIVPGGRIVYVRDFDDEDFFIGKLTPAERTEPPADGKQKIVGEPVYFSLRTPRRFDSVRLTVKFRNESEHPAVAAGVLADPELKRYDLKPLDNGIIDRLAMVWDVIYGDGLLLLQKEKKFGNIGEFVASAVPVSEIAVYNYDLPREFLLPDYRAAGEDAQTTVIAYPLRGDYQFYTYVKDEELDFDFIFTDINRNDDPDPIYVNLYYRDKLIDARSFEDDGVAADSGEASGERTLGFSVPNLPEGAYKLEVRANGDIITDKITTSQAKLAFINKLWLHDAGNTGIELYTDSLTLNAQTTNPARLQTVAAGGERLEIAETYKLYAAGLRASATPIRLEKDDVILAGNGVFSFDRDSLLDPKPRSVGPDLDYGDGGVNYIIARYRAPEYDGDWLSASADFDLKRAYRENGAYGFVLSISGLRAEDGTDDRVVVAEIRAELEGKTLREKIRRLFR